MVSPSHTAEVVSTRSTTYSTWYSSGIAPPSKLIMWLRLKPVAIFWSSVACGSKSPASCSMVNSSNGILRLKALMTQSRQCHFPGAIDVVAVGIGIARQVQPLHRHALAVVRRGQQAIHHLHVGVGGVVS